MLKSFTSISKLISKMKRGELLLCCVKIERELADRKKIAEMVEKRCEEISLTFRKL